MRRVLIIHYHFLPVHNVAVKRLAGYARRLPAFGWQPLVVTNAWDGIDDVDASWGLSWEPELERQAGFPIHHVRAVPRPPARGRVPPWPLGKTITLARLLFGDYPDEFVRWATPAVEATLDLARRVGVDAIISYCPPETNHVVGQRLARALGVPWLAFFGDLWGFFLARLPGSSPGALIRKAYHRWWLASAAGCAAPSPYMAEYLRRTYRKRVALVLTGFDPREFADSPSQRNGRRQRLVVSHVGSLYPRDQKPEIFFAGLDHLLQRHPEVEQRLAVRFVGSKCESALRALIAGRPSARVCAIEPKVDPTTAVDLVKASDVLLAFNCSAFRARHGTMSYPTKIFEAFGAKRPILAIPPDGDWVDALLARTHGGTSARDAAEVAAVLGDWFAAWTRQGAVAYHGRAEEIAAFTLDRQVERLAAFLDVLLEGRGGARDSHHPGARLERHA